MPVGDDLEQVLACAFSPYFIDHLQIQQRADAGAHGCLAHAKRLAQLVQRDGSLFEIHISI
ncbi:hypothetical protein D3C86_2210210 [compost metagenome]